MTMHGFVTDVTRRFPGATPDGVRAAQDMGALARYIAETSEVTEAEAREMIDAFYGDLPVPLGRAA